ncbi:formate/nitrite transporter FocA (FNT family) [Paenibacillus shirakamiensis]|uniref:Formate/nitrite transporter FocA (FNT family) n=1 Tax=Paenibacillus shirakamiensis TaxID=1265935 RepID=A0ABS4JHN5_9BACL|nr:formate/nitrite transporter FocA (FNT family) [Paenibacillus shirakamiensis]
MGIKNFVVACTLFAFVFFMIAIAGKDLFTYAPLMGWAGGCLSLTVALIALRRSHSVRK